MPPVEEVLEYAVEAINQGDLQQGRHLLTWVLRQEPNNHFAWLWMPACLTDERQKQECYRRISQLEPAASSSSYNGSLAYTTIS
jgi:Tfp pilus assembly protein PilF